MEIQAIKDEQMLRQWLAGRIVAWNTKNVDKVRLDWIEPTFGSSVGLPDCSIRFRAHDFGIELKHLYRLQKGVCWKIRPVQRRYHKMGVKAGKKLLMVATVASDGYNELVLVRGDKVPLRDYCSIVGSGCETGIVQTVVPQSCPLEYGIIGSPPALWTEHNGPFEWLLTKISQPSWWN